MRMITVNRQGDSITGTCNGEPFGVPFQLEKYNEMKALEEKAANANSIQELEAFIAEFKPMTQVSLGGELEKKTDYLFYDPVRNNFYLKFGDHLSDRAIPHEYVKHMLKSHEKGIDINPIIKNWTRWLRNPIKPSAARDQRYVNYLMTTYCNKEFAKKLMNEGIEKNRAYEMATTFQTPLTVEGLMCTYKVSEEIDFKFIKDENNQAKQVDRYDVEVDELTGLRKVIKPTNAEDFYYRPAVMKNSGDEFTCQTLENSPFQFHHKGHIIRVGCVHFLDSMDQVHPEHTGSRGLHVGNLDYIRSYQSAGTATHDILIDPMHIGGFSGNGDGALVTKSYFVTRTFEGVNRSLYYSSDYAKWTDAEYAQNVKNAVDATQMEIEKQNRILQQKMDSLKALL